MWAVDQLARDVVYMGLDPKDMPRVNINLPAAPREPPDPRIVTWPAGATLSTQREGCGTVRVSWPAAQVSLGAQLQYLLYVRNGSNWNPVPGCDQKATSCSASLGANASLYVIALNTAVAPPSQTPQLFGCYPWTSPVRGRPRPHGPELGSGVARLSILFAQVYQGPRAPVGVVGARAR